MKLYTLLALVVLLTLSLGSRRHHSHMRKSRHLVYQDQVPHSPEICEAYTTCMLGGGDFVTCCYLELEGSSYTIMERIDYCNALEEEDFWDDDC